MKATCLAVLTLLVGAIVVSGQDSAKSGEYDFPQLKDSVRRITTQHIYSGWDEKAFNRSGDMVAVAIVKTIPESDLTSPTTVKDILAIQPLPVHPDVLPLPTIDSRVSRCYCWNTYASELMLQFKVKLTKLKTSSPSKPKKRNDGQVGLVPTCPVTRLPGLIIASSETRPFFFSKDAALGD